MTDLDRARKMLLLPRADWCAAELERSAQAISDEDGPELAYAAEGTAFMAETMRELRSTLGYAVASRDRVVTAARFFLDNVTRSGAEVEAMYGRCCTLEQAAAELRAAIDEAIR